VVYRLLFLVSPIVLALSGAPILQAAASVRGANGIAISVDPSGSFDITGNGPLWSFGGNIGAPLRNLVAQSGTDNLGDYNEIAFDFNVGGARHASVRGYSGRPAIVFTIVYPDGASGPTPFPVISRYPRQPLHLNYTGMFAFPTFYAFTPDGPWLFFDNAGNTFIVSPLANYMTAATTLSPNNEIVSGMATGISSLPAGFTHRVVLVFDQGINRTFDEWGRVLTDWTGKQRPASDADASLTRVGYWTDNGATYYYHTAPSTSYRDTLAAVKSDFDQQAIQLGYIQLDSWFYPKGEHSDWSDGSGGIYSYTAASALFGDNFKSFQQTLGVPLITHARWIDVNSPYRQQYKMSGNVSIDPAYWTFVARYLAASGVATYEQDWLFDKATTDFNLTDPDAFLDNMAAAMAQQNITMQYCMPTPRHLMQSTRYGNLTTARVSGDRFNRNVWTIFLYASRLASALGIYPFTDVFMSSEPDNLLLATLSAGPVGVGDAIGSLNGSNLLLSVRQDGIIVKPDRPIVPIDKSLISDSQSRKEPLIASTYSDFGDLRTYYVFAFSQGDNLVSSFSLGDLGISRSAYVYNFVKDTGRLAGASDVISEPVVDGRLYYVIAPVGPSGIAVLGDRGNFVSMGKKRIPAITDDGTVHLSVAFAGGETVRTIHGYAPRQPVVAAVNGSTGPVAYNTSSQRFSFDILPGVDGTASAGISMAPAGISAEPIQDQCDSPGASKMARLEIREGCLDSPLGLYVRPSYRRH
jgi:hypothetical protein